MCKGKKICIDRLALRQQFTSAGEHRCALLPQPSHESLTFCLHFFGGLLFIPGLGKTIQIGTLAGRRKPFYQHGRANQAPLGRKIALWAGAALSHQINFT